MATVVDSLIVTLGLDPKSFNKGQKEAAQSFLKTKQQAQKAGKDIEDAGKRGAEFFRQLRTQVIGLFAAFTAGRGLKEFVQDVVATDAATGRLAKTLDTNTGMLSSWRGIAAQVGGTAAGITGSIQGLVQQFQEFALTGESNVIPYFRALGVNIADGSGKMRSMNDILLDLADRFHGMDPARAAAFGKALGLDEGTINLLIQGRAAVQGMLDDQKRLGVITEEDAKAGADLQKAWARLDQSSTSLGRTLVTTFAPIMEKVLNVLTDLAVWAREHEPLVEAVFTGLAVAATAIAVAILAPLAPIALLIAGITGVIAVFSLLYDDWQTWADGGKSLFGDFWSFIAALFTGSSDDIKKTADALFEDIKGGLIALVNFPRTLATALIDSIKQMIGPALSWIEGRWDALSGLLGGHTATAASGGSNLPSKISSASGQDDISKLMSLGWSKEQAAGIAANLQRESGGNAGAVGDSGKAYGLAQWHPDRQANFKKWSGVDIKNSTRDQQLEFVNYELRQGTEQKAGYRLGNATSADEAARIVSSQYERPRDAAGEATARAALANAMIKAPGVPGVVAGASDLAQAGNVANDNSAKTVVSNDTKIGTININTQATDANGIARDIGSSIERNSFAQQANYAGG